MAGLGRAGRWARGALFNPCPRVSYALSPHYSPGHRVAGQESQAVDPSGGGCRNGQWPCTSRGSDSITEHMWAGRRRQPRVGTPGALGHLPGFAVQQPLSGEHLGFAERPMASGIPFVPTPVPTPGERPNLDRCPVTLCMDHSPRPPAEARLRTTKKILLYAKAKNSPLIKSSNNAEREKT